MDKRRREELRRRRDVVVDTALCLVTGINLKQPEYLDYDLGRLIDAVNRYDALLD